MSKRIKMICPDVSPNKLENFDIAKISNGIDNMDYLPQLLLNLSIF